MPKEIYDERDVRRLKACWDTVGYFGRNPTVDYVKKYTGLPDGTIRLLAKKYNLPLLKREVKDD